MEDYPYLTELLITLITVLTVTVVGGALLKVCELWRKDK